MQLAVNFTLISILRKNFPVEYKLRAEEEKVEDEKKGDSAGPSPLSEGFFLSQLHFRSSKVLPALLHGFFISLSAYFLLFLFLSFFILNNLLQEHEQNHPHCIWCVLCNV
eukprot:TRINITY_DN635_c0_g1_i2.p2 TRINITY_DN635_c0_g1~~TRINITY_DN635_c0_g1_i2.p2  ORF type:complete len:110 (-),score=8.45 TRINITY_DN635_c0_g1_i2:142-471(-)